LQVIGREKAASGLCVLFRTGWQPETVLKMGEVHCSYSFARVTEKPLCNMNISVNLAGGRGTLPEFTESHRAALRQFRANLYGYAFALTRDAASAEDLLQDCMVRAMTACDVPAEAHVFRVWMFRVMRNQWIDRHRSQKRMTDAQADIQAIEAGEEPASGGEDAVVNRLAVRQAFLLLSKEHRDVLALVDIGGFSYDETAELLDIPRGTVMSRVSRGRSALCRLLSDAQVTAFAARGGRG